VVAFDADDDGVVPNGHAIDTQVLKDEHGAARRELGDESTGLGRDDVRDEAVAAGSAEQLRLQAAAQLLHVDFPHEAFGIDGRARVRENRGERGRPALIVGLREEGDGRELLDPRARGELRRRGAADEPGEVQRRDGERSEAECRVRSC